MLVTELETNEIVPSIKLLPWFKIMAVTNVKTSTGTSAYVWLVSVKTTTTMIAT